MLDSPERVVPDRVEQIGHTLEFLPEDNTVIRWEVMIIFTLNRWE